MSSNYTFIRPARTAATGSALGLPVLTHMAFATKQNWVTPARINVLSLKASPANQSPPELTVAVAESGFQIVLTFSTNITLDGAALLASSYSVTGPSTVTVESVSYSGNQITLTTTAMEAGQTYTVGIATSGILATYGLVPYAGPFTTTVTVVLIPALSTFAVTTPIQIVLTFNDTISLTTSGSNPNNWVITAPNGVHTPTVTGVSATGDQVTLTTTALQSDVFYVMNFPNYSIADAASENYYPGPFTFNFIIPVSPSLDSVSSTGANNVTLNFDRSVILTSLALTGSDWLITPSVTGTSVTTNGSEVVITTSQSLNTAITYIVNIPGTILGQDFGEAYSGSSTAALILSAANYVYLESISAPTTSDVLLTFNLPMSLVAPATVTSSWGIVPPTGDSTPLVNSVSTSGSVVTLGLTGALANVYYELTFPSAGVQGAGGYSYLGTSTVNFIVPAAPNLVQAFASSSITASFVFDTAVYVTGPALTGSNWLFTPSLTGSTVSVVDNIVNVVLQTPLQPDVTYTANVPASVYGYNFGDAYAGTGTTALVFAEPPMLMNINAAVTNSLVLTFNVPLSVSNPASTAANWTIVPPAGDVTPTVSAFSYDNNEITLYITGPASASVLYELLIPEGIAAATGSYAYVGPTTASYVVTDTPKLVSVFASSSTTVEFDFNGGVYPSSLALTGSNWLFTPSVTGSTVTTSGSAIIIGTAESLAPNITYTVLPPASIVGKHFGTDWAEATASFVWAQPPEILSINSTTGLVAITFSTPVLLSSPANTGGGWTIVAPTGSTNPTVGSVSSEGYTVTLNVTGANADVLYGLFFPSTGINAATGSYAFNGPFLQDYIVPVNPSLISAGSSGSNNIFILFDRDIILSGNAAVGSDWLITPSITGSSVGTDGPYVSLVTSQSLNSNFSYLVNIPNTILGEDFGLSYQGTSQVGFTLSQSVYVYLNSVETTTTGTIELDFSLPLALIPPASLTGGWSITPPFNQETTPTITAVTASGDSIFLTVAGATASVLYTLNLPTAGIEGTGGYTFQGASSVEYIVPSAPALITTTASGSENVIFAFNRVLYLSGSALTGSNWLFTPSITGSSVTLSGSAVIIGLSSPLTANETYTCIPPLSIIGQQFGTIFPQATASFVFCEPPVFTNFSASVGIYKITFSVPLALTGLATGSGWSIMAPSGTANPTIISASLVEANAIALTASGDFADVYYQLNFPSSGINGVLGGYAYAGPFFLDYIIPVNPSLISAQSSGTNAVSITFDRSVVLTGSAAIGSDWLITPSVTGSVVFTSGPNVIIETAEALTPNQTYIINIPSTVLAQDYGTPYLGNTQVEFAESASINVALTSISTPTSTSLGLNFNLPITLISPASSPSGWSITAPNGVKNPTVTAVSTSADEVILTVASASADVLYQLNFPAGGIQASAGGYSYLGITASDYIVSSAPVVNSCFASGSTTVVVDFSQAIVLTGQSSTGSNWLITPSITGAFVTGTNHLAMITTPALSPDITYTVNIPNTVLGARFGQQTTTPTASFVFDEPPEIVTVLAATEGSIAITFNVPVVLSSPATLTGSWPITAPPGTSPYVSAITHDANNVTLSVIGATPGVLYSLGFPTTGITAATGSYAYAGPFNWYYVIPGSPTISSILAPTSGTVEIIFNQNVTLSASAAIASNWLATPSITGSSVSVNNNVVVLNTNAALIPNFTYSLQIPNYVVGSLQGDVYSGVGTLNFSYVATELVTLTGVSVTPTTVTLDFLKAVDLTAIGDQPDNWTIVPTSGSSPIIESVSATGSQIILSTSLQAYGNLSTLYIPVSGVIDAQTGAQYTGPFSVNYFIPTIGLPVTVSIVPTPGTHITAGEMIRLSIQDQNGLPFALAVINARFPGLDTAEVVWTNYDGFSPLYVNSTVVNSANGWSFVLDRIGGWLDGELRIDVRAVDVAGKFGG